MASIFQRILGLSFLMGSVILGMTLAQSQVTNQMPRPASPPQAALTPEQLAAAQAYIEQQRAAAAQAYMAEQQRAASAQAPYPYSGAPIRPPNTGKQETFVPSEIETFQSSLSKHVEPRAIIHTTLGDVELRLYSTLAPQTVKNFLDLARGDREFSDARTSKKTRRPFYNGLTIHKVVAGEYIQMGCPTGNGHGGPGYTIPDEIVPQLKFDRPFVVAMAAAREGVKPKKDSNGSQFFITLSPQTKWDGEYSIFGTVTKGQKVLETIAGVDVGPTDRPIRKVFITSVDIIDEENNRHPAPPAVSQPAPASVAPPVPAPAQGQAPGQPPGLMPGGPAPASGGLAVPPQ